MNIQSGLSTIFFELITNGSYLLWSLIILITLFLLSLSRKLTSKIPSLDSPKILRSARLHLIFHSLIIITTIFYWIIDVHFVDLPDPVLPFIFYVLISTIIYGFQIASFTAIIAFFLINYYLFEPRYHLNLSDSISSILSLIGLAISLLIGTLIRQYQQRLLKGTEELKLLIKARDQFASIAAHDLKTPITAIKLYSQEKVKLLSI